MTVCVGRVGANMFIQLYIYQGVNYNVYYTDQICIFGIGIVVSVW
jgi:hypothetical protein